MLRALYSKAVQNEKLEPLIRRVKTAMLGCSSFMPAEKLRPPLPLPDNYNESRLFDLVSSVLVHDAPVQEMKNYAAGDFRRFVHTWGLTRGIEGRCLELGANPYFTTVLLKEFTGLKLYLANYFGETGQSSGSQRVYYRQDGKKRHVDFEYRHFNLETEIFPWVDSSFHVVIFAEIIEHLLYDPCRVLREIKRVLRPDGYLILTTPNAARLENVARLTAGENIYDPYSGYGAYGRHNREYTVHEMTALLEFEGFEIDCIFTADVHENTAGSYIPPAEFQKLFKTRPMDLGQYIFIKAGNTSRRAYKFPAWLYRSLPREQLA